jgi:hypothetical protein
VKERPTFFGSVEIEKIGNHCKSSGTQDVLEIGTYCGAATKALLQNSSGLVVSVDPLYHPSIKVHQQQWWIEKLAKEYPNRFIFIPAASHDVIWRRPISLLMIDGDHRPSTVIRDLRLFCPFVRFEGSVILDDMNHTPVREMWEYYTQIDQSSRWEQLCNGKLQIWRRHAL